MNFGSKHRKRRWYAVAIGGLAGVSGLAVLATMNGQTPALDEFERGSSEHNAARAVPGEDAGSPRTGAKDGNDGHDSNDGFGGRDGVGKNGVGRKDGVGGKDGIDAMVSCDSDELIDALVKANAKGGGGVELAHDCTYTLTGYEQGTGLPEILQPITIKGNGATIVRGANAEAFRIFNVGSGGDLELRDLTVKGGKTESLVGGGGLLVQEGGKATIKDSTFVINQSVNSVGGAIANYGVTKIIGDGHEKDGIKDGAENGVENSVESGVEDGTGEESWAKDGTVSPTSRIVANSAFYDGGGIYSTGFLAVWKTRVSDNITVDDVGGGISNEGGVAALSKVKLDHNSSGYTSSALFNGEGAVTKLEYSEVTDNTGGTAIDNVEGSSLYVRHSTISDSTTVGGSGGAFFNADATAVFEDSTITRNTTGGDGAGIYNFNARVVLRRSEVTQNKAVGQDSQAGGIFNENGQVDLVDTRVAKNLATNPPGGIYSDNSGVIIDDTSVITKNRPTNCQDSPVVPANCFG
jgi:hypothetical protein